MYKTTLLFLCAFGVFYSFAVPIEHFSRNGVNYCIDVIIHPDDEAAQHKDLDMGIFENRPKVTTETDIHHHDHHDHHRQRREIADNENQENSLTTKNEEDEEILTSTTTLSPNNNDNNNNNTVDNSKNALREKIEQRFFKYKNILYRGAWL